MGFERTGRPKRLGRMGNELEKRKVSFQTIGSNDSLFFCVPAVATAWNQPPSQLHAAEYPSSVTSLILSRNLLNWNSAIASDAIIVPKRVIITVSFAASPPGSKKRVCLTSQISSGSNPVLISSERSLNNAEEDGAEQ